MLLPLLASFLIVFGAPYAGEIRGALQSTFPDQYRWIIGGIVAVAAAVAIAGALGRVRRGQRRSAVSRLPGGLRPRVRYSLIAFGVALSAAYAAFVRSGNVDVDLVEAFHFVEYGLVTYLFYRAWRSRPDVSGVALAACAALAVGLTDEWVQWFVPGRVGEMHDVWLNATAICCGLLFSVAIHPPVSLSRPPATSRTAVGIAVCALLIATAGFVHSVHLGYEVRSSEGGTFRSRYDARALDAAAADRSARWGSSPPPVRGFTREDHYLSEGAWHIQRRNLAVTGSDWWAAWNENLILERFYAPVLDRGDRWPVGQRATIEARARADGTRAAYVSGAAPYPIYLVPPRIFWGVTVLLVAVILLLTVGVKSPRASLV